MERWTRAFSLVIGEGRERGHSEPRIALKDRPEFWLDYCFQLAARKMHGWYDLYL